MFSIIVPLFNESENIKLLLEEIEKSLNKFKRYEIVIVNDASTDNTSEILSKINNNFIGLDVAIKEVGRKVTNHKEIE